MDSSRVKINIDTAQEIVKLYGVGSHLAKLIVERRETCGHFHGPEDLAEVEGISYDLAVTLSPHIDWQTLADVEQPKKWKKRIRPVILSVVSVVALSVLPFIADVTGILGFLGIRHPFSTRPTSPIPPVTVVISGSQMLFPKRCSVIVPGELKLTSGCSRVFAIPSTSDVVACLPAGTKVEVVESVSGLMGGQWYRLSSYFLDEGPVKVTQVLPNSPAQEIGLQVGDIVLRIDDLDLSTTDRNAWLQYVQEQAGQRVRLLVQRNGQEITLSVVPRTSPPEGQGPIGYAFEGGILQGDEGYMVTWTVTCVE